jgi:hypothetical protein
MATSLIAAMAKLTYEMLSQSERRRLRKLWHDAWSAGVRIEERGEEGLSPGGRFKTVATGGVWAVAKITRMLADVARFTYVEYWEADRLLESLVKKHGCSGVDQASFAQARESLEDSWEAKLYA